MTRIRRILAMILLLLEKKAPWQIIQTDFNLARGANDFSLGKISLAQDRFGYMWFTDQTNNCLVRYDGNRMKIFRNDPGDSNSLTPNTEALQLYLELESLRFVKKIHEGDACRY